MKTLLAAVLAIAFLVPAAAQAGPVEDPEFVWAPRYLGRFTDYFPSTQTDLTGVQAKIGRIAKGCPAKLRGARLTVKKPPMPPVTSGFFSVFGDANQKREPAEITFMVDPAQLRSVNSQAVISLDSPFVPITGDFLAYTRVVVNRQADDSLIVFVNTPGGNVGDPTVLPADTPGVIGQIFYENDTVDVTAKSCLVAGAPITIASAVPLLFEGSAGVGGGVTGQKGDGAGIHIAVTGDLYEETKRDILTDLQAVIDLELAAGVDLDNQDTVAARAKIEQARVLIEDHGPEVQPPTMPATFEPSLNAKIGALPESDMKEEVAKRVGKAGTRDAKARDMTINGSNVNKVIKELDKANTEKQRAKAVLETGVKAEAKF
jgi:hypothetical protein